MPANSSVGPQIPEGHRVYAIGDIHGRIDLLDQLHAAIRADCAAAPYLRATLIHLGDYVDRGPGSREVIERLAGRPLPGAEHVCLMGNHEDLMLSCLDGEPMGDWVVNGGDATLRSYGVQIPPFSWARMVAADGGGFDQVAEPWRQTLIQKLPEHHRSFLEGLATLYRIGDYCFVHGGVKPGVPIDQQSFDDLLWIRDEFLDSTADHGAVIVHGHTIVPDVCFRPNRISIDTGAWRSDKLSCLVLEGGERRLLQT